MVSLGNNDVLAAAGAGLRQLGGSAGQRQDDRDRNLAKKKDRIALERHPRRYKRT